MSEKELIQLRLDKIQKLRDNGVEPYAYTYTRTHEAIQLAEQFATLAGDVQSEQIVSVAGRMIAFRGHGKTIFANLQESTGKIQVYFRAADLGPEQFDMVKHLDIGDFLGVTGPVFRTHSGELTIKVQTFTLLAKSLRALPEKWHGLKDVEARYRQRYLDILANEHSRNVLQMRSKIIKEIRAYLDNLGFMEVETPMMQPIPGGAAARPFITHHNALDRNLYLRIAPELYLKRLLVGGFEKVFELNRNFRNEGISTMHNPEFTMMEVYQAYVNADSMMVFTENLFAHLAKTVQGTTAITYQGHTLELAPPWRRLGYVAAVQEKTNVDVWGQTPENLRTLCRKYELEPAAHAGKAEMVQLLFENLVEPNLIQPTFIVDFPIEISPLAKQKAGQPAFADRFEPYIAGHEYANGFSELNDPTEQRKRFEMQVAQRERGDEEAQMMDEDYVRALEYGMPPAGGLGVGIDRLVMLLTDSASIRDVILFPQLRQIALPPEDSEIEDAGEVDPV